ncbi:MAG: hypothetical protein EA382_14755 [Spirochaetaceae bacterium]|nr:MAG: hypothetical protein EA382_14755 [Spirochaetaceae bacterium]
MIGNLNETTLHEQIKLAYAEGAGLTEQAVGGFFIDVVTDDELIEVQTRGLGKLRRKIVELSPQHPIRIVHPVARETVINKLSADGELISSRRSPKRGRVEDAFREIVSIADLLPDPAVTIDVLIVDVVETRIDDGTGSWRRRGVRIAGRALARIVEMRRFSTDADYLSLLPTRLRDARFTNADVIAAAGLPYRTIQPITSTLRKMDLLRVVGRDGRNTVYETNARHNLDTRGRSRYR